MWERFGRRRRKRRTGRGDALRQTLSALGSVRRHARNVADVARYNDNRGAGRSSGTAFTKRLLPCPKPLRRLVVGATVPVWIAWTFIEQAPLWVAFHRLLGNQAATQQSRDRLTTGWRNA
jgi:hypothetical protein